MFLKELSMPERLIKTAVLNKRLVPGHLKHPDIEKDLAKRRAGYWGETLLNSYLQELPQDKYLILHDLQLKIEHIHFQIDFLLLSQYLNLIIEAKNISGSL